MSVPSDLDAIPEERFDGAFLKLRDSQRFHEAMRVKAIRIHSRAEARERLTPLLSAGLAVIVQDYVPGPASAHYFIDGFMDRLGRVRALFARQRLRMYPPLFGNSTFMKTVEVDVVRSAADSLTRLLEGVGYRGVFSAEFKHDPRDGAFKLLEVNARAWWYVDFAARCGVDVCGMAYEDALEREVKVIDQYRVGRALVYPYADYFACTELRRSGDLTMSE